MQVERGSRRGSLRCSLLGVMEGLEKEKRGEISGATRCEGQHYSLACRTPLLKGPFSLGSCFLLRLCLLFSLFGRLFFSFQFLRRYPVLLPPFLLFLYYPLSLGDIIYSCGCNNWPSL